MQRSIDNIIECYNCGLFIKKNNDQIHTQRCPRCNSKIKIEKKQTNDSLYYSISALLLFGILNIYPIISLNINDEELKATLLGTVSILLKQNFFFVSLVVFFTIVLASATRSFQNTCTSESELDISFPSRGKSYFIDNIGHCYNLYDLYICNTKFQ